jgi:hypothetical protein
MEWLEDRRFLLTIGGGVLALLISLGIAVGFAYRGHKPPAPPPASVGGLVVQMGRSDDAKLDPTQPLRCFVGGQFIGMETLASCAQKNGVATKALDVGVDPNGALAAASGAAGANLTPLPPPAAVASTTPNVDTDSAPVAAAAGLCQRYEGGAWRKAADGVSLSACVQALFGGHCESTAVFGRWSSQTLRLWQHKVGISSDNKSFRQIAEQGDACAITEF